MEISAPAPRQLDWRTATLVAGGIAALELILLLIIGIAVLSKPLAAHAKESAEMRALGIDKVVVAHGSPITGDQLKGLAKKVRDRKK